MTRTPTTLQPFTNLLLAELRRLDLLDKNKEVARRCNEALGKAGYILGPQLYRVGGAVPEDGWSSEGKRRAITVTSRTVTRWKQGVIPVGAHLEAVVVNLFSDAANEASDEALSRQEAFLVMLRFGVGEEELKRKVQEDKYEFLARSLHITNRPGHGMDYLLCACARSVPFKFGWDAYMWSPPTPSRAEYVIEEVAAEYARAGKTPPMRMADWIRRLMALEWCRRHGEHAHFPDDCCLFFTSELVDFMKEHA